MKPSLLLLWTAIVTASETRANYDQDYSPCVCFTDPRIQVYCSDVPVETARDVFQRVEVPEIYLLQLNLIPDEANNVISLPSDLLANTSVASIDIYCGLVDLIIDPSTFRNSQNSATYFWIDSCEFNWQKDFSFLNNFNSLQVLNIYESINISPFQYLPPLPSLYYLDLYHCPGLNDIPFPDLSPSKLEIFDASFNSLNDKTADAVVASLPDSLVSLYLNGNVLTKIPGSVLFTQLKEMYLDANNIAILPSNAVTSSDSLRYLSLRYNSLKTIESGAFQGNYSNCLVNLEDNKLVFFEEKVFKQMLEQIVSMQPQQIGHVYISRNPFGCGCDVAWLVRDNRHLLPAVFGGVCAIDSPFPDTRFEDLTIASFANCSGRK